MKIRVRAAAFEDIRPWRDMYRKEMDCQIIHDSIHHRRAWTQEYVLEVQSMNVGYGSVAVEACLLCGRLRSGGAL